MQERSLLYARSICEWPLARGGLENRVHGQSMYGTAAALQHSAKRAQ